MITYKTRNDLIDTLPKDLVVVELGVFRGEFSNEIHQRMHPSTLYLVDIWKGTMGSGDKDGQNHITINNMEDVYHEIKDRYSNIPNVQVIRNSSLEFLNSQQNDTFDAIYVDADHHYHSVKADLIAAYHKLKNGGYLMGHDYIHNPYEPAVIEAVTEFCNEYNQQIEALTLDGCPSFLIQIKK